MTFITVLGDPESLAVFLQAIVDAGNNIDIVQKTWHRARYVVAFSPSGPVVNNYLLMEDGSYLLLENGDRIIL
jgi:hypothetical protein